MPLLLLLNLPNISLFHAEVSAGKGRETGFTAHARKKQHKLVKSPQKPRTIKDSWTPTFLLRRRNLAKNIGEKVYNARHTWPWSLLRRQTMKVLR